MTRSVLLSICFAAVFAAGCFDAPKPACAFLCGDDGSCPADYTCRPDGWCKRGTAADVPDAFMCDDTNPPPMIDAAATIDSASGPDATIVDAALIDAGLALGSDCTTGDQCNSGFCSDLVCCEEACTGDCNACSTAAGSSANGTCDFLTTECRASTGECDPAESCTGSSATCPTDAFSGSGTQCTDTDTTDCDDAQCDGAGACVQAGGVELASFVCRPAAGECDVDDNCNGTDGGACPTDVFEAATTPCTDTDTTDCDDAQCNGVGLCVQDFGDEPDKTTCADLGGGEDTCCAGVCIVAGGTCP